MPKEVEGKFYQNMGQDVADLLELVRVYSSRNIPYERITKNLGRVEGVSLRVAETVAERSAADKDALVRMIKQALSLGATAVVGHRLNHRQVIVDRSGLLPRTVVVKTICTGTAVTSKVCFEKIRTGYGKDPYFSFPCKGCCDNKVNI